MVSIELLIFSKLIEIFKRIIIIASFIVKGINTCKMQFNVLVLKFRRGDADNDF
jgi:hypothetical protein